MDEANFFSTKKEDDITKILLAGYEKDKLVPRMNMHTYKQEFFPTYGPKVLANHAPFEDIAHESRTITITMETSNNLDIPISLPDANIWPEAESIRNDLLAFRIHSLLKGMMVWDIPELSRFEKRTAEIFRPLAIVSGSKQIPDCVISTAIDHEKLLSIYVDNDPETAIARTALDLFEKKAFHIFAGEFSKNVEKATGIPVTPRKVSSFLRLYGAKSTKWGKGYRLDLSALNVELLSKRYCAHD